MKNKNEDLIIKVLDKDKSTKETVTGRIRGWKRENENKAKVSSLTTDK